MNAPPFVGRWRLGLSWRLLPALGLGVGAVLWAPQWSRHLRWRHLLACSAALAVAWAVALSFADGFGALTAPLESRYEYLRWVPRVGSPGRFLRTFVDQLPWEATHVKSHPPGMVLTLWGLDRLGLGGSGAATALILAGAGAAVAAVLVGFRNVAGEAAARRAAPFLALLPAAVWMATSPDAFFLGVTACGAAVVVVATARTGAPSYGYAFVGGLLLGAGLFLSYGMVALSAVPGAVVLIRRRWSVLGLAAAGVAAVVVGFALAGFWWHEGLAATHERYQVGVGEQRNDRYFLVANMAALAVAVGPAVAVGWSQARRHRAYLFAAAATATLVVINVSGLSEGEVERIWLPFVPWVATAAAGLPGGTRSRPWLALQVGTGLGLQAVLRSPW